ncbi:MAG: hypothetical protein R2827_13750 [Bdellovibrionales bacterium]
MKKFLILVVTLFTSVSGAQSLTDPALALQSQDIHQEQATEQLGQVKTQIETQLKETEQLAEKAEKAADSTESALEKALADYLVSLKGHEAELLEIKLVRVKDLESLLRKLERQINSNSRTGN